MATSTADYWVGATIGEGSFGKVVHARHKSTEKDVAVKVVPKLIIQRDPKLIQGVIKERRLLTELKSEHVVPLWASFHDSECLYLVMECCTGGDLSFLISQGKERLEQWTKEIPSYGLQLLSALEFIHSRGIIHADLKPDNLLISSNQTLVLADFGCAIELRATSNVSLRYVGTADYASPEVVMGDSSKVSIGIDLWSLGCILFAMWEGESPFHAESDALAVRKIAQYRGEPLSNKVMTDDWMRLIRDLLTPNPSTRLGTSDLDQKSDSQSVEYSSIRLKSSCWAWASDVVLQAVKPPWWTTAQETALKDGATGWSVFLL